MRGPLSGVAALQCVPGGLAYEPLALSERGDQGRVFFELPAGLQDLRTVNPDAWKPGVDVWLPCYSGIAYRRGCSFWPPRWAQLLRQAEDGGATPR